MSSYMTNLSNLVGKIVLEAKISVIDDIIKLFTEKGNITPVILENLSTFKESVSNETINNFKDVARKNKKIVKKQEIASDRKKREPSMFNLFVKNKIPELKNTNPDTNSSKVLMSLASEAWKTDPFAIYIKENVSEMKKECNNNNELFEKLKSSFLKALTVAHFST